MLLCDASRIVVLLFMHLYLASHLGTLDEPREGRDNGAKLEDGVWWTYPKDGRTPGVHA